MATMRRFALGGSVAVPQERLTVESWSRGFIIAVANSLPGGRSPDGPHPADAMCEEHDPIQASLACGLGPYRASARTCWRFPVTPEGDASPPS
jgi:hypothetical protein